MLGLFTADARLLSKCSVPPPRALSRQQLFLQNRRDLFASREHRLDVLTTMQNGDDLQRLCLWSVDDQVGIHGKELDWLICQVNA